MTPKLFLKARVGRRFARLLWLSWVFLSHTESFVACVKPPGGGRIKAKLQVLAFREKMPLICCSANKSRVLDLFVLGVLQEMAPSEESPITNNAFYFYFILKGIARTTMCPSSVLSLLIMMCEYENITFFFNVQTATFRGTLLHCEPKINTKHQRGFVELEFFACMSGRDRDAGASGCGVCVCDCSCGVCFVLSRLQGSAAVWRLWWWQQQRLLVQPLHPGGAPGGMVRLQQQTPRTSQK